MIYKNDQSVQSQKIYVLGTTPKMHTQQKLFEIDLQTLDLKRCLVNIPKDNYLQAFKICPLPNDEIFVLNYLNYQYALRRV